LRWATLNRPLVLILTDGSGSENTSRLEASRGLVIQAGARIGPIFGRFTDREFYKLIVRRDVAAMLALAEEIALILEDADAEVVASDMAEGFNPGHDLCQLLVKAAVVKLRHSRAQPVEHYEFTLENLSPAGPGKQRAIAVTLTDEEMADKHRRVLKGYPQISAEVERMIAAFGIAAVANEDLYKAEPEVETEWLGAEPPFYERYGATQVEAGRYAEMITYASHIRPLALALRQWSASA
jgi:hypothetical protein